MKAADSIGDFYIPEGETRTLRFVGDWFWYQGSTLITLVICREMKSDEPLLLRQYGSDQMTLELLSAEPDPSAWVEIERFEGSGWRVEVEGHSDPVETADDAMK